MTTITEKQSLMRTVEKLIAGHMLCYSKQDRKYILLGLDVISEFKITVDVKSSHISIEQFQNLLSKINEKEQRRRDEGVYYTPKDITEYIAANSYLFYLLPNVNQVHSVTRCLSFISRASNEKLLRAKVFDPTCGTAEFLLSALQLKLKIFKVFNNDKEILKVTSTIYGNDIAEESILLSKIRIFFAIVNLLKDKKNALQLGKILNKNFGNGDFVINPCVKPCFEIILGNPPYVEYGKLQIIPSTNFGNTYADVLKNSIESLKQGGVIGFIIPLSFVSTPRMKGIRSYVCSKLTRLFALNFADRPDCLFEGVHQKLTLLFGQKGNGGCNVYSSSYYHWYNDERYDLLNKAKIVSVVPEDSYIPKIGTKYELSIFNKILDIKGETLPKISKETVKETSIFLNMRGCFWMKAFSFNPGSNEYKRFYCPNYLQPYLLAVLNSTIFFLFWTIVSDCWHITGKELNGFKIPISDVKFDAFRQLVINLERRLEETKKYVGSKQTLFEYKHRDCKNEIDKIDKALQGIYHLTDKELSFLKDFKLRYRMSNG